MDENCGSESITKIVEDSVISHQNASIGPPFRNQRYAMMVRTITEMV